MRSLHSPSRPQPYRERLKHCNVAQRSRFNGREGLLACVNPARIAEKHKMVLLPSMHKVVPGTEPRVSARLVDEHSNEPDQKVAMWDRTKEAHECYQDLLSFLGNAMLSGGSKGGRIPKNGFENGLQQLLHPQTSGRVCEPADLLCHMPAKQDFPPGTYLHRCKGLNTWYTWLVLGRDSSGDIVKCRVHVLIAAARHGVPDEPSLQALHLPSCPNTRGGCNNPLHLHWGTMSENRLDREKKRHAKHEGPTAEGPIRLLACSSYMPSSSLQSNVSKTSATSGSSSNSDNNIQLAYLEKAFANCKLSVQTRARKQYLAQNSKQ